VIRELHEDHEELAQWAEKLGVAYCGEGTPACALKVFKILLKGKRHTPTAKAKEAILEQQHHRCAVCGDPGISSPLEFDHVVPLRQLARAKAQQFRALCRECHRDVTSAQQEGLSIESRFSRRAWDEYVMSPRAPPAVWQPEKTGADESPNV
jgi:5-methylcytosine-specific restriction endonuclease McrA